ncbi:glycoside hydrolase family 43 protein [Oxalobacteraceae bacterium A2-2]
MKTRILFGAMIALACLALRAEAGNPIIQTRFTADPAPMVHDGVLYLYTSHDEEDAQGFKMLNWMLYSTTDMVNWRDHGVVASLSTFPWAVQTNDAWAPQVVERDGKFYLYVPVSVAGWPKNVIAVAVADHPAGPFRDALGHPLIDKAVGYIDPTVAIDDDGQAYLYWGNPELWYVKLNRDMISYSGSVTKATGKPANYQEGPWFYKRSGRYYMAYASTCCPEGIGYAMSDSPTGPWNYKGMIMHPTPASSGNHPGIVDYKGHSYLFGFNYQLNFAQTPIHRERRSVTVASFGYERDGTISTLSWWNAEGVQQLEHLDPYKRVEAETIAWTSRLPHPWDRPFDWAPGVTTAQAADGSVYVTNILDRSYIKVAGVDFGAKGATGFSAAVASGGQGGQMEIRLGAVDGELIGTLTVPRTGDWNTWQLRQTEVKSVPGVKDVFFVFKGKGREPLFNIDYWQFSEGGRR